jgi:hypothetical protein
MLYDDLQKIIDEIDSFMALPHACVSTFQSEFRLIRRMIVTIMDKDLHNDKGR